MDTWGHWNRVGCIEEPYTMHGARHTAGCKCIHEQFQCERPHKDLASLWARSAFWRKWKHRYQAESRTSQREQCYNQQGVSHETRLSKDHWESTYFMIFWKSWNWPSYSRECLWYWSRWHLVAGTSSLTVNKRMSGFQYFRLWMWRHVGTQHWSCSSVPTDYWNTHGSGSKIQTTPITGNFSQLKMNGPLWSMSWKYWGHFDIGPCGCRRGIQSHSITLSRCTMTCWIIWMAWCELWFISRLHG